MNELYKYILAGTALSCAVSCAKEEARPNILYIMSDDHAFQAISAYGNGLNQTPNIDMIADQGICFNNCYVSNSISGPSRAVMMTGKFSHMNGFRDNKPNTKFDGEQQTLPKLLQANGYQTAVVGKWHLGSTPIGFDYYCIHTGQGTYYSPTMIEPEGKKLYDGAYATTLTREKSVGWLKQRDQNKPFFLMMHFKAPHRNWLPEPDKYGMYDDVTFPLPETFYDDYADRQAAAEQAMSIRDDMLFGWDLKMLDMGGNLGIQRELDGMTDTQRAAFHNYYDPICDDLKAEIGSMSDDEITEWKYQRYMRDYMTVVSSVDDQVGEMIQYLKDEGLWENTIVIYTADQGFYLGEHGWFDKRFIYEESMRTPLLIHNPMAKSGRRSSNALVQNIDFLPTILDCAGVEIPSDIQGVSIKPILDDEQDSVRDALYYHYYEYPQPHEVKRHYGVRTDRYKLAHFYYDIDKWELYDLKRDPHEMNNIIDDPQYSEIKAGLERRLKELQEQYQDTNPTGDYVDPRTGF